MNDDEFEAVLRKFRREMLGPMVEHMDDTELDAWMEPWRALTDSVEPGCPAWLVKRRDEARRSLLRVLQERAWCMGLARAILEAQGLARPMGSEL